MSRRDTTAHPRLCSPGRNTTSLVGEQLMLRGWRVLIYSLRSGHLEYWLYFRRNVGRKALVPGQGPWVFYLLNQLSENSRHSADVHQFSIITELLGTPPDDVIATIASENTLRFVQSLPKRQRVPFSQKFKTTDETGEPPLSFVFFFSPEIRPFCCSA